MHKNAKIYIAGHAGLVGSAITRALEDQGYHHLITQPHRDLDLCCRQQVERFFDEHRPEYVVLAAAKVGGILANDQYPANFFFDNISIQTNVIDCAHQFGVKRLIFLGSSCIYPRDCPQPIQESYLMTGPLELTNQAYAMAKIAGIEMCAAYNRQYGTQFLAVMPTNMYGPGDNYHPQHSHVIPGLIQKIDHAKQTNQASVCLWGTGKPKREFLYSEDFADAVVYLLTLAEPSYQALVQQRPYPMINVGTGKDMTIAELAELIAEVIGYQGKFEFDRTKPDGTPRKLLDVSRIQALGWKPKHSLREGLIKAWQDYVKHSTQRDATLTV